jgi:hypothetical protein
MDSEVRLGRRIRHLIRVAVEGTVKLTAGSQEAHSLSLEQQRHGQDAARDEQRVRRPEPQRRTLAASRRMSSATQRNRNR